jgi:hypothetical protein
MHRVVERSELGQESSQCTFYSIIQKTSPDHVPRCLPDSQQRLKIVLVVASNNHIVDLIRVSIARRTA